MNPIFLALVSLAAAAPAPAFVTVTEVEVKTVIIKAGQQLDPTTQPTPAAAPAPTIAVQLAAVQQDETTTTQEQADEQADEQAEQPTEQPAQATETAQAVSAVSPDNSFANEILTAHNNKRAIHGVQPLTWDSTLESYAAAFANNYDCSGSLSHSGGQYGENLALGYTTTGAVDGWYSEGDNYNYGSGCSVYDHFTQIVWKSTTALGCASKSCGDYWGDYIVCSYNPAGNFVGQCDSNVLSPN